MTRRDDLHCISLFVAIFSQYFGITPSLALFAGKPRPRVVWYRDDRPLSTPSWTGTDPGSGLEVQFLNLLSVHLSIHMVTNPFTALLPSGGQQQPNDGTDEERLADPAHVRDLQL